MHRSNFSGFPQFRGVTKKERRLADSRAPLLQLNQSVPYLTGSPPSRQRMPMSTGCRCRIINTFPRTSHAQFLSSRYLREIGSGSNVPAWSRRSAWLLAVNFIAELTQLLMENAQFPTGSAMLARPAVPGKAARATLIGKAIALRIVMPRFNSG